MKKLICLGLLLTSSLAYSQNVGIGTNAPNASAKLHIEDNTRGLLIPNVTLTNVGVAAPVTTPATGLLVWNTNAAVTGGSGQGFYYWSGTQWLKLSASGDAWELLGNAGTNPSVNFVGTTDAQDLVFRTNSVENMRINTNGNVGIGTTSSAARLYVQLPTSDAATAYGIYNNFDGTYTGTTYAMRNHNYGSTNSTKYGFYNNVSNEGTGARYGIYNLVYMNTGAGTSTGYGAYNYLNAYGTGNHRASYNYLYLNGTDVSTANYASYNLLNVATSTNTSTLYGEFTSVDYSSGTRYGEYKDMATHSSYPGTIYADYNFIDGAGNDLIYGVYADITNTGTGTHYGIYSDVPGGTNDYAAFFNAGNVVSNEIGGDYDFRIESVGRTYAFMVDGGNNVVRMGCGTCSLSGNGTTIGTTTVDYVADFDRGGATGTAIGIGSIEYLLDMSSETTINNRFSPSQDNIYDLGSATLRWDDVYATNGTIVTSDRREKEQIVPLEYGLAEIMLLRPVTYKWKNRSIGSTVLSDDQKELKLGLIAQEVQEVLPEVVQTHDWKVVSEEEPDVYELVENERLGMSYHEIVPVLIKATQEQQEIIQTQEDRIETLERELEELKQLILENKN